MGRTKGAKNKNHLFHGDHGAKPPEDSVTETSGAVVSTKNSGGAPSKFDKIDPDMIMRLSAIGASLDQMAYFFGVHYDTLYKYKKTHPEYFNAILQGQKNSNDRVKRALLERAVGYNHPEKKVFCYQGEIVEHEVVKHYPPDVDAIWKWLLNKMPEEFKDKKEVHQTGETSTKVMIESKLFDMLNAHFVASGEPAITLPAPEELTKELKVETVPSLEPPQEQPEAGEKPAETVQRPGQGSEEAKVPDIDDIFPGDGGQPAGQENKFDLDVSDIK